MADTFRRNYTPLSDQQRAHMDQVKIYAEDLEVLFDKVSPRTVQGEKSRCINIARTKLEEAVMWAVKGITTE